MTCGMGIHLDSDLLRTFVAVAETGNFTRAGDQVRRTQSAVSMQIKRLEETVGPHFSSVARAACSSRARAAS